MINQIVFSGAVIRIRNAPTTQPIKAPKTGISAVKPKAAFYIFPKIDIKKFNITDDEKFVLDFLKEKHILLTHGGGFHWEEPDHFRIVYLPNIDQLKKACKGLDEFLAGYHQIS